MHTNGREVLPSAAVGPQKKFVSGVGVLSVATLISKMIGLFYRIPLVSVIGIGGMAYFLAANHLYITLYLVFAAGLPSAIAVLVSERRVQNDHNGAVGVYRTALSLFFALGAIFSFALFFFSESAHIRFTVGFCRDVTTSQKFNISPLLRIFYLRFCLENYTHIIE